MDDIFEVMDLLGEIHYSTGQILQTAKEIDLGNTKYDLTDDDIREYIKEVRKALNGLEVEIGDRDYLDDEEDEE